MKPRICRIKAGGTIEMKKDPVSGVLRPVETKEELLEEYPKLFKIADIDPISIKVNDHDLDKDSSDIIPDDWIRIVKTAADHLNEYDGVFITHGTDTMHYTSAALSFMLQNLSKTLVLTGSQIPSGEPNSDAGKNLYDAVKVSGYSNLKDVCIVFNSKIIKGTRAKKIRVTDRDAYESFNYPILGRAEDIKIRPQTRKKCSKKIWADTKLNTKVGHVKVFPGMGPEIVDFYVDKGYKGIIIEGFGAGHTNTVENSYTPSIKRATDSGIPVFLCTQCYHGKVELKYGPGERLRNAGAIGLYDMLPEVAVVKLMYVTGHYQNPEEIRKKMLQNMAGEMTL